jgi:MGT family glycosyltransferase
MLHVGMGGHIRPAIRLGAVLARQGHEVIAWGPEGYRSSIEASGAEFVAHDPLAGRGPQMGLPAYAADLAAATERCIGDVIDQLFARGIELVVHDCHVPWARVAGDFLGLPRIISNPLFPGSDATAPKLSPMYGWVESLRWFHEHAKAAQARVETSRLEVARRWGIDLGDWSSTLVSTAPHTVSFTTAEISGKAELDDGWRYAGPLMDPAPPRVSPAARPLVYVAFGTAFNNLPMAFRSTLAALAHEEVDVIASTGRSSVAPAGLGPLPANAVVHEFVDSREVLARASVHVTHGGCSSVHESLLAGVPMVCLPVGADQFDWAGRVEELGAGQTIEMTPEAIRGAVRRMLVDRGPRERAVELGRHLASYDGPRRVGELVEEVLAPRKAGEVLAPRGAREVLAPRGAGEVLAPGAAGEPLAPRGAGEALAPGAAGEPLA